MVNHWPKETAMALTTLPQLEKIFLTDAGLETDIIFNRGIDLPYFASITLLQSEEGKLGGVDKLAHPQTD